MVTENIDVVLRERGGRIIKRRLDEIGVAANNATRAIFLLQRAFFVIGGAGILRGLVNQLDALTNYENRLRLTAESSRNLEQVQDGLFAAANRSRTGFSSLAEIYTRTALSVKDLGISQAETLRFTESLAKATIISGASAREANAALIQLSQGLASNRLSGDELRSVLEQLPFVAQVIAESLGVTRGELRKLGMEGKISAEEVLKAFRDAETEIDRLFAQTVPTIAQALTVATNNFQKFLDTFDDATGASSILARSIILISENLATIATGAGIAAIAAIGFGFDLLTKRVLTAAKAQIEFTRAVSSGRAVILGSVTAQTQKAQADLASAQASNADALATLKQSQANVTHTQVLRASALAQVQNTEFVRVGTQARILATGQYANLTAATLAHEKAVQRLNITNSLLAKQQGAVAAAQVAATGAAATLATATTASGVAAARAATLWGRFSLTFPALAANITRAGVALRGFTALLLANPITVLFVAITAAAVALSKFGDASEQVNAVISDTDQVLRDVKRAFEEAEEAGTSLAETYDTLNAAQLNLKRSQAIDAQREAVAALADQLIGFNAVFQDLRTALTLDSAFRDSANELVILREELASGQLSLIQFKDAVAQLGAESDSPRFRQFAQKILDAADASLEAKDRVDVLEALIAQLNGTATAAQTALLRMASGLDNVGNSANIAAGAIDFFISKIPALAAAAKVSAGLQEAQSQLNAGQAALDNQLASGKITTSQYTQEIARMKTLYNQATKEIDGTAEKQRDFNKELERNSVQAELAGLEGLNRTLRSNQIEYEGLRKTAIEAGASQAQLNQLAENFNAIQAAARRDASKKKGGGGDVASDLAAELAKIDQEIALLAQFGAEQDKINTILQIEDDIKRKLTETEKALTIEKLRSLEVAKEAANILTAIEEPNRNFEITQAALNDLFAQGAITLGQYVNRLKDAKEAADAASGSLSGGFVSSISQSILNAQEFGSALGDIVVGGINSAADAIVEFAKTGKINLRQLFQDFFAQLAKLAAQQLLLRLVGGFLGIPAGGLTGGGPIGGGLPFASGGSILPTGPGSTDTRLIPLMTRPDERIDILTPGQQAQQAAMMRGANQGPVNVAAPQVNVAVLLDPADIAGAFDSDAVETAVVRAVDRKSREITATLNGGA